MSEKVLEEYDSMSLEGKEERFCIARKADRFDQEIPPRTGVRLTSRVIIKTSYFIT